MQLTQLINRAFCLCMFLAAYHHCMYVSSYFESLRKIVVVWQNLSTVLMPEYTPVYTVSKAAGCETLYQTPVVASCAYCVN